MKKILLTFFSLFLFWNIPVNAKSISDQKDEEFCLPKDISKGFGCVWKVGHRTKGLGHQIQIVSKEDGHPVRIGKKSIRFEVRPGECGGTFDGSKVKGESGYQPNNDCDREHKSERAEIYSKYFTLGEKWYSWSIYIPDGQEKFKPASLKMGQFHSKLYQKYIQQAHFEHNDGKYTFNNMVCGGECKSRSIDPIGKWTDILINVKWSHKKSGFYKVWANGKIIYDYSGPTIYEKKNKAYLKIGIYRNQVNLLWASGSDGGTTVVYYDNIRTGKTMNSVIGNLDYNVETEYQKTEAELIQDEIAVLTAKVKKNYDAEISKKIKKLKRKLRRLELN